MPFTRQAVPAQCPHHSPSSALSFTLMGPPPEAATAWKASSSEAGRASRAASTKPREFAHPSSAVSVRWRSCVCSSTFRPVTLTRVPARSGTGSRALPGSSKEMRAGCDAATSAGVPVRTIRP